MSIISEKKEDATSKISELKRSDAGNENKKSKTARLQLALPEQSFERLEAIKGITEAASYAEVVRRALRIYEGLLAETYDGSTLIVHRPDGTEQIVPIGVAL